jgi:hypothetical protein
MSVKSTVELYKRADSLHQLIDDTYNLFEDGKIPDIRVDTVANKTLNDVNRLLNILNKINVQELEGHYDEATVNKVQHNVDFFYEAADYIEKYVLGKKYGDALKNGVANFIDDLHIDPVEYKHWAKSEEELAKKFTAMLIHPNNISRFINQIKRMALGTMSLKEFKKIFDTNKNRMILPNKVKEPEVQPEKVVQPETETPQLEKVHENYTFESFAIYKTIEYNE